MRPNPQFPADLVAFTEEIFNGKLHFFVQCKLHEIFQIFKGRKFEGSYLISLFDHQIEFP